MQMSTSRNLAVWLHEALDRFPTDPLRFYLASNLPETGDVIFSWRDFQSRVNSDLIGNLGNYINRVLFLAEKYFEGEIPRPEELSEDAVAVLEDFRELEARYEANARPKTPRSAGRAPGDGQERQPVLRCFGPLEDPQGGPGADPPHALYLLRPARLPRLPRSTLRP